MQAIAAGTAPPSRWLVQSRARGTPRARVVCFSHAGGGASAYARWHRGLPSHVEICAVQLPGRETRIREPLRTDFDGLVHDIAGALDALPPRPAVLFGHSLGALFAFEVAHALRGLRPGAEPAALIVSAAVAPHGERRRIHLGSLSDEALLRELSGLYGGVPSLLLNDPELTSLYATVLRADLTLLAAYKARRRPPLSCPIAAWYGRLDRVVNAGELSQWAGATSGPFSTRGFDGGHFYLQEKPEEVLAEVATHLVHREEGACNSGNW